jgi:hypothetical protein
MKVTLEYIGGPRDGVFTFDWPVPEESLNNLSEETMAKLFYLITDQGQVGMGSGSGSPAQSQMVREQGWEAVGKSDLHPCYYGVISREETSDGVRVRAKYYGTERPV